MPRIAQINTLEVPHARDDFRVGFPRTGADVQQDERFHVDLATDENLPFLFRRVRRDPSVQNIVSYGTIYCSTITP